MDATMSTSIPVAASLRSSPRQSSAADSVCWAACRGTAVRSAEVDGGVTVVGTAEGDSLKVMTCGFILRHLPFQGLLLSVCLRLPSPHLCHFRLTGGNGVRHLLLLCFPSGSSRNPSRSLLLLQPPVVLLDLHDDP